jgi:DNA-3-methyladenine glycosylase I
MAASTTSSEQRTDGLVRCSWATSAPEFLVYHDEEWGQPVRQDPALYERMTLESWQSGQSRRTKVRKRGNIPTAIE